jgi:hypothetical protein
MVPSLRQTSSYSRFSPLSVPISAGGNNSRPVYQMDDMVEYFEMQWMEGVFVGPKVDSGTLKELKSEVANIVRVNGEVIGMSVLKDITMEEYYVMVIKRNGIAGQSMATL